MEPAILRSPFPAFQRESKAQYYPLSRWCRSLDEGDPAGSATSASATAKRSTIRLSVAVSQREKMSPHRLRSELPSPEVRCLESIVSKQKGETK
jgi:hypothetical protein